jgi:hypothetical protein
VKKARKGSKEDRFAISLKEFMDRLPEIVALMKPEPLPQLPYTPYRPPPGRWVLGKHMAVNMTQLLDGADWIELCLDKGLGTKPERPMRSLLVHRGDRFMHVALTTDMEDLVIEVLREHFPDWLASWPELPPKQETPSKEHLVARRSKRIRATILHGTKVITP